MSIQTSEIKLNVNDKKVKAYLANGGGPGVLVLHAWWGLKPFFKQVCDQLAEQGFTVLAPDLRDGQVAQPIDEAKALMEKIDGQFIGDIVITAKDHLREMVKGQIGAVGFSMGAAWALVAASYKPEQFAAIVLFLRAGAIGGKVCGAGGGGYMLLVVPPEKKRAVDEAMGSRGMYVDWGVPGSQVVYDDEAQRG